MTRAGYLARQRDITRAAFKAEREASIKTRMACWEALKPIARALRQGEPAPALDKAALARTIAAITKDEGRKPCDMALDLQGDMEASIALRLGLDLWGKEALSINKRKNSKRLSNISSTPTPHTTYTDKDWKEWRDKYKKGEINALTWRLFEKEYAGQRKTGAGRMSFMPERITEKAAGSFIPASAKSAAAAAAEEHALMYTFTKRRDLSASVWTAVEDMEKKVFNVVNGGIALGRDPKDICKDLEIYIKDPQGGLRVQGRWGDMFPNTDKGRREAFKREYLAANGGFAAGSAEARLLLAQPQAKNWLREQMEKTGGRGQPILPLAVKRYMKRLGSAGLDYRAIRVVRTETAAMLADEQEAIARESAICSGKVEWVLKNHRERWGCRCADMLTEGEGGTNIYDINDLDEDDKPPLHPNCDCELRPILKSDNEIMADFKKELAREERNLQIIL